MNNTESEEVRKVKKWLQNIVIHYNFCPFAKKPFKQNKIRYFLSHAETVEALVDEVIDELLALHKADVNEIETTIMIVPGVLKDFEEYNEFGVVLDQLIASLKLTGIIQIATFHPDYQFADLDKEDVRNYTNRSPYPLFHLIREDSIEQARASYADIDKIPEKNMDKLETMGLENIKLELKKL